MHKNGDKVRIISGYSDYIGKIGIISDDNIRQGESCVGVKMGDGGTIYPFLPYTTHPQCEFIEESVQEEKYSVDKIRDKNIWIACPTQEEWNEVCEILAESGVKWSDKSLMNTRSKHWGYYKGVNGIGYRHGNCTYSPENQYPDFTKITAQQFITDNTNNNNMDKQTIQDKIVALEKELNSLKEEVNKPEWVPKIGEWIYVEYGGNGASGVGIGIMQVTDRKHTSGSTNGGKFIKVINNDTVWALPINRTDDINCKVRKATPAEIKEAENKSITLTIGSNSKTVVVKKDEIVCDDRSYKIGELRAIVNTITVPNGQLSGYEIHIEENVRFIRVGCSSQGNLFSIEELKSVIKAYEKLNN